MLQLVHDYLKTKMMCKNTVKMLLFLIKYVPDRCNTRRMSDKVILENGGMLMFVTGCYKDQNMCNKGVANYAHAFGSV